MLFCGNTGRLQSHCILATERDKPVSRWTPDSSNIPFCFFSICVFLPPSLFLVFSFPSLFSLPSRSLCVLPSLPLLSFPCLHVLLLPISSSPLPFPHPITSQLLSTLPFTHFLVTPPLGSFPPLPPLCLLSARFFSLSSERGGGGTGRRERTVVKQE